MSSAGTPVLKPVYSPLDLNGRSLAWRVGAVVAGTLFLALCSYIEVPMVPVPINMQTFGVALIGALYGWRLGAITVVAWLAQAAVGMPVLSGGAAGAHHFVGPTAGYLFAFPLSAALAGWLAEKGWNGERPILAFGSMLLSNAVCLAMGAAWLAVMIGFDQAIIHGVTPFLVGAVLKSALGAATLALLMRGRMRSAR
ncbi:biotin transporter BioY [Aquibium sp. A9E412]|uniref:biotin transporter BioY n=1 Tax=Aquibium sp. A9E412 TaxID=2976767 RepID=UPI0025AEFB46|nr:biotin transporter BioY [Aquibium sp. A9E412]MDN2567311.1 biotin transporter BioY [Aquibium sp. A9E412]